MLVIAMLIFGLIMLRLKLVLFPTSGATFSYRIVLFDSEIEKNIACRNTVLRLRR